MDELILIKNAMDTYTMTFKYDGLFDLPDDPKVRDREVPRMVLEKLERNEFELIDFNLTQNYGHSNAEEYLDSHLYRAILEIRLDLTMRALKSRAAIYACCVKAMEEGKLCLDHAYENENKQMGMLQSVMVFDMKKRQQAPL